MDCDAPVDGPHQQKQLCAIMNLAFYNTYSLQMRSAYDAIILGTEKNVLNPEGLYIAMRHQREMLMVSAL